MEPLNSSSLGAMGSVLKKLDDLRTGDEQAKGLIVNLGTKLKNLSEVHDPPFTVKYWMTDARELSYDMEVCLDQFAMSAKEDSIKKILESLTVRVKEAMGRFERYNLVNRYLPSSPNKDASCRLFSCKFCEKNDRNSPRNDISTDLSQNPLASVRPTEDVLSHNLQNLYMEAEPFDPIGMEDPSKLLDEWLKLKGHGEGDLGLKVVSVLGDGGVGKSTLAKRLWRASEGKFDCRSFVQMSKKPDMMMVLRSILSQVRPKQPSESFDVRNLIQDLKKHLQDKRYFIIIDDLWDVSAWHIIGRAFPKDNYSTRMAIITTAVENIAQECCNYDRNNIVIVKRLQEDQSKKLFVDTAFGSAEGCSPQFNDVIDKITRKCGGLPLAITCTARFVGRSQPVTEKKQLLDYVNTFLHDNLRTHSSSKEILNQVLKLCYSSLPHCLKTCLLYLSVYPENYSFLKEDLVKQWIAEDFICTQEKKESVALSYFELLLNLGLIQRMDIFNSKRKRLLYYTVHPMVFDFVTSKSMEENFVRIIDYSQSKMVLTEKIRRLSLHFGGATYATIPAGVGLSQVRTLGFMGLLGCLPSIEKFELVRVLILHLRGDDGNERSPLIDICKLRLLRYLQVRSNATLELPGQMQCLEHLETLDINAEVSAVPSNTLHNQRLTHIRLGRKTKQKNMPQGPVTPSQIIFPENLVYRKLPQDVQVFELLPPICSFSRLPGTVGQLTKLRILEVVVRELGTYDLDLLGKLAALTVLSLYVRKPATQRTTFHTSQLSFPALEYFKFVSGQVLLDFPEKAMPKLWKLKICFNARGGEKYSNMLRGIHHLENLQEVVACIGTANGDEDSDFRKAAESAFEQAIQELERMRSNGQIRHNVKWVDKVDEEYDPPESSNKWGEISEEIQNEESTEQHDGELRTADRTHNPLPPVKDDAAPIPSQNKILRRPGQASDENSMYFHLFPEAVNVLEKLLALQQEELVLLWRLDNDIDRLYLKLRRLCDTIRSCARVPCRNFNLHSWERHLFNRYCDLAYDIEDWADLLALRIHVDDRSRVGSSSWISQLYHRTVGMLRTKRIRNIISDIKDLVVRVDHLSRYVLDLKISVDLDQQFIKFEPQEIMPHDRPTQLVGHKRPMDEVINMLMDASNVAGFKIVSIVGMAGSGKTTLAEAVYQRIKGEFDSCVFFSVGYQGTLETTLEGILRQVEMKVQESKNIQQNITKLRKLLEANRYLIVLDDLWRLKDWGEIENCFPRDNLHSRIIITTRNDALALRCCSGLTDCIYKIGLLSDVDSKQLFHNEVFGTGHSCPKNLEIISAQILEKCGGLPLAIVTAAGILAQGQSEDERRTIGLKMLSSSDSSYMWQQPIKFEPQEIMPHDRPTQLVGHKRPMDKVINMLMDATNVAGFKIISIVGMAGSGKTTLAEAVYQRIKGEFDSCVFFSVGHQGTIETTVEGMLRQIEMKEQESKNIQQNITKLTKLLEANRYLIVLDDLWRKEDWEVIENCFPRDNLHSRIIITTRNDVLALHCCSSLTDCIYKIGLLSDADSKQLFLNEVFGTGHSCPDNLENVSAQILKKCGGLPLAIVIAASKLKHCESETTWREIGLNISSSSYSKLNPSYNDLPPILKSCLLYLSMFPEYYWVNVDRLVRLWIAEGFIIKENIRAIEETAGSYLDGLISRNMVLPLHVNHHGIPKYCMVHPVIHDFIVHKSKEENFIAILNDQHQDVANKYGTVRRLSIQRSSKQDQNVAQDSSMDLSHVHSLSKTSHVHSIIVIGQANTVPRFIDLSLVRILDLEGCDGMSGFLHGLHKLPLLRYLSLRGTDVRELPKVIEESRFLQTLDVRSTNVKKLPRGIVRLEKLMHLLCGRAQLPHEISKMYGLRTLSCDFAIEYMGIGAISELVNLMELELFCNFTQIPQAEKHVTFCHGGFERLKKLCIRCNSASVTFESKTLPLVEELELSFEEILGEEPITVSGIEHLLSLKHVLLEFGQQNGGTMAIVDAVRKAASTVHPNHPEVTVNEAMRSIDRTVSQSPFTILHAHP